MENIAKIIAQRLLRIEAVKLSPAEPFTWASGLRSPIYCDNRIILSYPAIRTLVIEAFREKAQAFLPFDGVAGVATAGIAHGALLAQAMGLPFIYVRSKAKGHGRQNMIEGAWEAGQRWLVIEDLISTGGSSLQAVEALREAGCQVAAVLAIFTYGFPAAEKAFAQANCPLDTLTNYAALLTEAVRANYIPEAALRTLDHWRQDPQAWSAAQQGS